MKKKYFIFSVLFILTMQCFAASLSWGMKLSTFEKEFETEQKYETDFYSIIQLPKNSPYKNEFDEYLLFVNDIWVDDQKYEKRLVKRLQITELPIEECKKRIRKYHSFKEKYDIENNYDFPLQEFCPEEDAILSSEILLNENSLPVILMLQNRSYNYAIGYEETKSYLKSHEYRGLFGITSQPNGSGYDYCTGLFLKNGANYLILEDGYSGFFFRNLYEYPEYSEQIESMNKNYVIYINNIKLSTLNNVNKEGPFGTFFGMKNDDLPLICKENSKISKEFTDISLLNEKIDDYEKYYSLISYSGITTIKKFTPKKSVDSISEYYAIFDNEKGLYQVFTIAYYDRAINYKEMDSYSKKNAKSFSDLKSVLTKQYGQPKERNKNSLYWTTENGIKIELFSEEKLIKLYSLWDGKEYGGEDYFTCLVYTDIANYEELVSSEKKTKAQDLKEKEEAAKKKEFEQQSFF